MLNNTGPTQNDPFQALGSFPQFVQPGIGSNMNNSQSNYQKRPGGGPVMQPGVQGGMGGRQQQHQRSAVGTSMPQHFPGQYNQSQRADSSHMGGPSNLLSNMGGLRQAQGAAVPSQFPSLPPASRAANLAAANALGSIRNMGQKQRMGGGVNMDSFLNHSQAMQQASMGFAQRPNAMDARSAASNMMHGIGQAGKAAVPNGHIPNTSLPLDYGKKGAMHAGLHQQQHMSYMRADARMQSGAAQQYNADKEGILNASDFPVLGGMNDNSSAADGNLYHSASQYSHTAAHGKKDKPDNADFPALNAASMNSLANNMGHMSLAAPQPPPGMRPPPGMEGVAKPAGHTVNDADKFGLKGLLPLVRMHDSEGGFVALGIDLQTLGLNLNSSTSLYSTLLSPFQVGGRPGALDHPIPKCYLFDPPALNSTAFKRFTAMSVFYVFYVFAGEDKQLMAAEELISRGWIFHKSLTMWMRPDQTSEIEVNGVPGEQGVFDVFDPNSWSIQKKDNFFLDRRFVEDAPVLA